MGNTRSYPLSELKLSSSLIFVFLIKEPVPASKAWLIFEQRRLTTRIPFIILIPSDSLLKWFSCTKETPSLLGNNVFTLEPDELIKLWRKACFWQPGQPYVDDSTVSSGFWVCPWSRGHIQDALSGPPIGNDTLYRCWVITARGNFFCEIEGPAERNESFYTGSVSFPSMTLNSPNILSIRGIFQRPIIHW